MKLSINDIIANVLFATLEANTAPARAKLKAKHAPQPVEKPAEKFGHDKAQAALKAYTSVYDSANMGKACLAALSVLFDAPELVMTKEKDKANPDFINCPLLSVVYIGSNNSGHGYTLGPNIVTHSGYAYALKKDGEAFNTSFKYELNLRYATAEEIKQCVRDLTEAQWDFIRGNELFRPVIDAALATEVEVEEAAPQPVLVADAEV
jgi:hypothetical protein